MLDIKTEFFKGWEACFGYFTCRFDVVLNKEMILSVHEVTLLSISYYSIIQIIYNNKNVPLSVDDLWPLFLQI